MLSELFKRMQYEPSILLFGNKYKRLHSVVLNYKWNAVVTTNCDLALSSVLKNDTRAIIDVINKDDMQANLMDRKRLHIIRLFGDVYPTSAIGELDSEDITDQATYMLTRISEIIQRNGLILVEDFEETCCSHKELRKAFRNLYHNQKQILYF